MARSRYRDDDDDDRDDYDRRNRSSGAKTLLIILGVFGAIFLLIVASCAGVMYYGFNQAKNAFAGIAGANLSSETFFNNLQSGRIDEAYNETSTNYKATTSRKQFDDIVKNNPILTSHTQHFLLNPAFPQSTNGKFIAVMSYRLSDDSDMGNEADDPNRDEEDDLNTKPKRKEKENEKGKEGVKGKANDNKGVKTKDTNKQKPKIVNVTVIEENGKWVIDKMDIS